MATSAQTLATILENLSVKYKFDKDEAIGHLATLELLPKKLSSFSCKTKKIYFLSHRVKVSL